MWYSEAAHTQIFAMDKLNSLFQKEKKKVCFIHTTVTFCTENPCTKRKSQLSNSASASSRAKCTPFIFATWIIYGKSKLTKQIKKKYRRGIHLREANYCSLQVFFLLVFVFNTHIPTTNEKKHNTKRTKLPGNIFEVLFVCTP